MKLKHPLLKLCVNVKSNWASGVLDYGKADKDDDDDDGNVSTDGVMYHQRAPDGQPIIIQMLLVLVTASAV